MKFVRYTAAGLLALTGIVHIAQLLTISTTPIGVVGVTVLFAIAYLVIAFYIYRESKRAYWLGVVLPILGILLTAPALLSAPTTLGMFFVVVDVLVVGCCAYLIYRSR
jgi:hypothetical protein